MEIKNIWKQKEIIECYRPDKEAAREYTKDSSIDMVQFEIVSKKEKNLYFLGEKKYWESGWSASQFVLIFNFLAHCSIWSGCKRFIADIS